MGRPFSPATAEQVVSVIEAVMAGGGETSPEFVEAFCDIPADHARAALELATDLGLLTNADGRFTTASPLCRFLSTPREMQKAAVLRVMLESYRPFLVFRDRLIATGLATQAAQQAKAALELEAHHEAVKDTLISLGTYSQALVSEGAGRYRPEGSPIEHVLETLAEASRDIEAAEARIRNQLGDDVFGSLSRGDVIEPLANAMLRAGGGDARGAVVEGGNAVDSYLDDLAAAVGVDLTGSSGINSKLEKLRQSDNLPKKLLYVGKYLGHIRNAADHGADPDVNAAWSIRQQTGLEYVFVACSFIVSTTRHARDEPPSL